MADYCEQFLRACSDGNLDLARQLQPHVPLESAEFLQGIFIEVIKEKNSPMVEFLIQCSPESFVSHFPDSVLLHAMDAGPQIYALFISKDPSVARRSFGHMGDALGLVVMRNDATFVKLLLDNGASPSSSKIFHKPTTEVAKDLQNVDREIMRMLSQIQESLK
ncbi:hypothetical protein F4820DRAFT_339168 [Hypoxylon rubiginosum]|uniref:Uncharacterized protein n=1 Tax=Hypoxylon rubiginosum TaxID=110542 RepID=A0ACB9YYD8_9PEZI|nr:hypothetical protein F4820DRAFT_339168 [Hypoxylon rubiginosum]